jgi:hypothetical protein
MVIEEPATGPSAGVLSTLLALAVLTATCGVGLGLIRLGNLILI